MKKNSFAAEVTFKHIFWQFPSTNSCHQFGILVTWKCMSNHSQHNANAPNNMIGIRFCHNVQSLKLSQCDSTCACINQKRS